MVQIPPTSRPGRTKEDAGASGLPRLPAAELEAWEQLFPAERHRIVNLMIERVDFVSGGLKIQWRAIGWKSLIGEFAPETLGAELVELEETT
jgi:hypothetical protein